MDMIKRGQIAFEYLIIVGFLIFVLVGILGVGLFYSGSINDRIKLTQLNNCANKIISTSESIFYFGEPSKATIKCYFPENVKTIEIIDNYLIFAITTNSGVNKISFRSNVPISGNLTSSPGLKKIEISAYEDYAFISVP